MRPFKFRAYDLKWKRWISPDDITYHGPDDWTFERRAEPDGDIIETAELKNGEIALMEFVGVNDANGNAIIEGDILRHGEMNFVIRWNDEYACFEPFYQPTQWSPLLEAVTKRGVIVGNVHDNPELLNDRKKTN